MPYVGMIDISILRWTGNAEGPIPNVGWGLVVVLAGFEPATFPV